MSTLLTSQLPPQPSWKPRMPQGCSGSGEDSSAPSPLPQPPPPLWPSRGHQMGFSHQPRPGSRWEVGHTAPGLVPLSPWGCLSLIPREAGEPSYSPGMLLNPLGCPGCPGCPPTPFPSALCKLSTLSLPGAEPGTLLLRAEFAPPGGSSPPGPQGTLVGPPAPGSRSQPKVGLEWRTRCGHTPQPGRTMASHASPELSCLCTPGRPPWGEENRLCSGGWMEHTVGTSSVSLSLQSQGCCPGPGVARAPQSPRQARGCLERESRLPEECFGLRPEDEQDLTGAQGWKGLREEKPAWLKALRQEGGTDGGAGRGSGIGEAPCSPWQGFGLYFSVFCPMHRT